MTVKELMEILGKVKDPCARIYVKMNQSVEDATTCWNNLKVVGVEIHHSGTPYITDYVDLVCKED